MSLEKTLLIVKPDAVEKNKIGEILSRIENAGFRIVNIKMIKMKQKEAEEFYEIHREKEFFASLVKFMSSNFCVPVLLEGENAVLSLRDFIGKTNPNEALCGTIRYDFGTDIQRNAVHASDSKESAKREIKFFFSDEDKTFLS